VSGKDRWVVSNDWMTRGIAWVSVRLCSRLDRKLIGSQQRRFCAGNIGNAEDAVHSVVVRHFCSQDRTVHLRKMVITPRVVCSPPVALSQAKSFTRISIGVCARGKYAK